MSPEVTGNQDPRTKVENFNDVVNSIIEANSSRPFDGLREQSDGRTGVSFNIGGYRVSFINFEEDTNGSGNGILWMQFKPNFGIKVETSKGKYTFASDQEDPTKIRRHFRYGGLIGSSSVSQLPDLFISEIELDSSQIETLLSFVRAPHMQLESLKQLLSLTDEEELSWRSERAETARKAREHEKVMEAIVQARRMPGIIG